MKKLIATKHCIERLKERFGVQRPKDVRRILRKAMERGLSFVDGEKIETYYKNMKLISEKKRGGVIVVITAYEPRGVSRNSVLAKDPALVCGWQISKVDVPTSLPLSA